MYDISTTIGNWRTGNLEILGIDAGGYKVKVATKKGCYSFYSNISREYRDLDAWKDEFGEDEIIWEYEGGKGFAGSLAKFETLDGQDTLKGETKSTDDVKLRVLLACHKYATDTTNLHLIVGQPIDAFNVEEKEKIRQMLIGSHDLYVNGKYKKIVIKDVRVTAETLVASLANPVLGVMRYMDIASGNFGFATTVDGKAKNRESGSLNVGMEQGKGSDEEKARLVVNKAIQIFQNTQDRARIIGGGATVYAPIIQQRFPNAEVFYPVFQGKKQEPIYANSIGMYELGRRVYSSNGE